MPDAHPDPLAGCLEVCRRCRDLVAAARDADPEASSYPALGPHLRHCLDHMTALVRGSADGVVDYDARDRDPAIERSPERFLSALTEVERRLEALSGDDLTRTLEVHQLASSDASPSRVRSTLARELVFVSSHTIHHLALMLHLARSRGVVVDEGLGVAFSTAAYLATQGAHSA